MSKRTRIHPVQFYLNDDEQYILEENGRVDILDVKCDPDLVGMIIQTYGFLPGYHMNKQHWITILLDDSVSEAKTLDFLDMSYDLIDSGK